MGEIATKIFKFLIGFVSIALSGVILGMMWRVFSDTFIFGSTLW